MLKTTKLVTAFLGPISVRRLKNMFLSMDPLLLKSVQLVLGEELEVIGH